MHTNNPSKKNHTIIQKQNTSDWNPIILWVNWCMEYKILGSKSLEETLRLTQRLCSWEQCITVLIQEKALTLPLGARLHIGNFWLNAKNTNALFSSETHCCFKLCTNRVIIDLIPQLMKATVSSLLLHVLISLLMTPTRIHLHVVQCPFKDELYMRQDNEMIRWNT